MVLRFGVVAEGFDPVDVGLAAKPGELALGVVAMALLGFGDGVFSLTPLEENGLRLTVAERVEGLDGSVAGEERAGFFDETGGEHLGAALIEAVVESGARRVEADAEEAEAGERIASLRRIRERGWRAARQTSMARMSLGVSLAWMRAADTGSRRVSSRCSQACRAVRSSGRRRLRRSSWRGGPAKRPSVSARR